jgi:hypothetical protein
MVISVGVFLYSRNHWTVTNGQFGDLLAGTVGVGASIGAMLFIIVTLAEQRKMNKQIEVHHLVESFNSVFDRLIHLFNSNSEVEEGTSIKVKKHLEHLWFDDEGVQFFLGRITNKIRISTINDLTKLRKLSQDEDLTRISRPLNRLLSIKCKIGELDTEAVKRVDDDWESIPQIWKEYAGFYFGWHSIDLQKSKNDIFQNEMINLFSERNSAKLPEFIPQIKICNQEDIFKLSASEFAKQVIQIESNSAFKVKIVKMIFSGYSYYNPELSIDINDISLIPRSSNTYSFQNLLGAKLQLVFDHIKGAPKNGENREKRTLYQDIVLIYNDKEWIYENQIEFNSYPNNHASILLKEITE